MRELTVAAAACAAALLQAAIAGAAEDHGSPASAAALEDLKTHFRRPEAIPFPPGNPYSAAKAQLGRTLFFDTRLSGGGTMACASCHVPELAWEDGRPTAVGENGQALARHTPTLWNLAWGEFFFWDGRATSLEEQATMPIESHIEMNQPMSALIDRLRGIPDYRRTFAAAFPEQPKVARETLTKALATYERTLMSPETAFDRWIAGDENAIDASAKRGFLLFTGKANCSSCHSGWAFTDHAFHDIGLPGGDRGRGAILDLAEADHAFKTPTLRDIARRAPYMHDGSLASLEQVIRHYESGFLERPTLSADMRPIALTPEEEIDLLAFLNTLTSPNGAAMPIVAATMEQPRTAGVRITGMVSQHDKMFDPDHVRIRTGESLAVLNDDTRTHNIRINDVNLDYNSGAQEPGETVTLTFDHPGRYYVFCAIHPKMKLIVEVVE